MSRHNQTERLREAGALVTATCSSTLDMGCSCGLGQGLDCDARGQHGRSREGPVRPAGAAAANGRARLDCWGSHCHVARVGDDYKSCASSLESVTRTRMLLRPPGPSLSSSLAPSESESLI